MTTQQLTNLSFAASVVAYNLRNAGTVTDDGHTPQPMLVQFNQFMDQPEQYAATLHEDGATVHALRDVLAAAGVQKSSNVNSYYGGDWLGFNSAVTMLDRYAQITGTAAAISMAGMPAAAAGLAPSAPG